MLKIQEFILTHDNWEALLKEPPYSLSMSRDENLIIFSYNMINSDPTNEIVKEARGLILEAGTFNAVCVPFFRFYNHTESYCDTIDWNTARVLEKVDGSIIKMYYYNNKWSIATDGVIDAFKCSFNVGGGYSSFGALFVEAIRRSAPLEIQNDFFHGTCNILNKNFTYIFELISPFNRIVVPYDEIAIRHTGTRDNVSLIELCIDIGVKKPKEYKFSSKEECYKIASELPFSEEGYVVVDAYWHRIKVKSPAYLAVHHLRSNDGTVSNKRAVDLIISGESIEFLSYYKEYEDFFVDIECKIKEYKNELLVLQKYMDDNLFHSRKELAMWAKTTINSEFVFGLADEKFSGVDDYIEKVYKIKGAERIATLLKLL